MKLKEIGWMLILAAVIFTNILESMILMPLASTIKTDLGMDDNQWGVAISVYLFAAFVSGIISIFFIDKFDRKKFLLLAYGFFIVGTLLCGISDSYPFLVFARIAAGFFGGVISAIVLAFVGDLIKQEHRGKATGIVMAGFATAAALGIPLGIYLGLNWNWHFPFFVIVGFSILTFLLILIFLPSTNEHVSMQVGRRSSEIFRTIRKNPNQLRALAFLCCITFGQFAIIPYLADYIENNVGFEKRELVWVYFFGGISTFITVPIIGWISDKLGKLKTFLVAMLISCIPIVLVTSMGENPIPMVLVATSGFFVFSMGRGIPATAIVIGTAAPQERGGFMSIRSAVQQLASGFAVLLGSLIIYQDETGQFFNFEWVGYLAVFTSITSYFILRKVKQEY